MFEKRYNKYKAERQTFNGRSYHSKKEADYAVQLAWQKKAGEIKEITPQFKIDIRVNGKHITNYYIDFRVVYSDDRVELIEVKGFATPEWMLKFRLTEALLDEIEPGAKLVIIK
ncbi:MAG TPA: DUF1064 domain-containing protein [Bacteroidales bacterium]|nr:DUF1064 domain-containing protein [Bacteroidales bacterium]